jgi:hypothetical protein
MSVLPEQLYCIFVGAKERIYASAVPEYIKSRIEQEVNGTSKYVCLYCRERIR